MSLTIGSFVLRNIQVQTEQVPWSFGYLGTAIGVCSMAIPVLIVLMARLLLPNEPLVERPEQPILDLQEEWDTSYESENETQI